jgi:hypothetical protein
MADDNVVKFRSKAKKASSKIEEPRSYEEALAEDYIKNDAEIMSVISALSLDVKTASAWAVHISEMQTKIDVAVNEAFEKSGFHPIVASMITLALAQSTAESLAAFEAMNGVTEHQFNETRKKALWAIAKKGQIDDDN